MHHRIRWTEQRIERRLGELAGLRYKRSQQLPAFSYRALPGPDTPPPLTEDSGAWEELRPGQAWGAWNTNFVLRCQLDWPQWGEALYLPLGESGDFSHPEALLYIDEHAVAGVDRHHQEIRLRLSAGSHRLALHGWTGRGGFPEPDPQRRLCLEPCRVVALDHGLEEFLGLARCALGLARQLEERDPARGGLLNALEAAFQNLEGGWPTARLQEDIARAGHPLDVRLWATGHAHLDLAWLWTYAQGRHKAARTFHTVSHLMEEFPDFRFTQSQPALYDWIRQDHPALFARIQDRVREGRWEPTGGMWVEADTNLSGAETLVRQLTLGQRFYRRHFGERATPILWLPDVFGYPACLPQLMVSAGLQYFFTIKIGWSQYNRLPFDSFWWEGLDGTRILTSFSTTPCLDDPDGARNVSTYNALANPEAIVGSWTNALQKEHQRDLIMTYGYGDGGGGPTREMLENLATMASVPSAPKTRHGSALEFFRSLEANSGHLLPRWRGELYLELHRGTYTSQARIKRANRSLERSLHNAEALACLADARIDLESAWQKLCLNGFHDVLPGSSIAEVYEDAARLYKEAEEEVRLAQAPLLETLAARLGGDLLLTNTTSFARTHPALIPWSRLAKDDCGYPRRWPSQSGVEGLWVACPLEPYSIEPVELGSDGPVAIETGLRVGPTLLENALLRVELDSQGDILRIFDKTRQREVLAAPGNQWQAFEDRPLDWDAWDVDIFFDDTVWQSEPATRIEVLEQGPLVASLEIERQIRSSRYRQRIRLAYNSARLDFETWIDWRERHTLLKVAFPVEVRSAAASYGIQWGAVERPTHRNTSWDWARFEVCAHRWADLSEGDYGVSLLSNSQYGYDVRDNVLRLSLLRGATWPDPEADQGEHHFTYSLLPHTGRWGTSTICQGYLLDIPVFVFASTGAPAEPGLHLVRTDVPWAVIETVKPAQDGRGLIVRLYESQQCRGPVRLSTGFALGQAFLCDLMEENEEPLEVESHFLQVELKPFQIVTLRLIKA